MSKKLLAILLTSSILLTACSSDKSSNSDSSSSTTQSSDSNDKSEGKAYNFTVKDADGKDVKLSDFKGKKVFILAWDPSSTKTEISFLKSAEEEFYQEFKDRDDFVFLSVTYPSDESFGNTVYPGLEYTKDEILANAKELGITFPILFDYKDNFKNNYPIEDALTHIFIHSDGTIYKTYYKFKHISALSNRVDEMH